jgi:hypothetical protein
MVKNRASVIAAVLLTGLACSTRVQAGGFDLSMADEITNRFSKAPRESKPETPPLVDFVFSSRAVHEGHGPEPTRCGSVGFYGPPITWLQREDVLLAELRARESQIAADLKTKAVVAASAPVRGHIVVPSSGPTPLIFDWREAMPKAAPLKGWSGMTLAVQGVALRFGDEGATRRNYR